MPRPSVGQAPVGGLLILPHWPEHAGDIQSSGQLGVGVQGQGRGHHTFCVAVTRLAQTHT